MATGAITPPPGFELEQPHQAAPPPGFELEDGNQSKERPGFKSGFQSGLGLPGPISDTWSGLKHLAVHPLDSARLLLDNAGEGQMRWPEEMKSDSLSSPVAAAVKNENYPNAIGQVSGAAVGAALGGWRGSGAEPLPARGANRVPLWKQAGVEAGRQAPNVSITHPPEPTGLKVRAAEATNAPTEIPPAPYRKIPGEVPVDVVGEPNRNILAAGQGIIVRQPKLLKQAPSFRPRTADAVDDMAVNQEIQQRVNAEDVNALRDEGREYRDRNSPAVPKWKQIAEIRAQLAADAVMKEAEATQAIPARYTKTRPLKSAATEQPYPPAATADEDLLPKLEESLRQARAKKAPPRAGK